MYMKHAFWLYTLQNDFLEIFFKCFSNWLQSHLKVFMKFAPFCLHADWLIACANSNSKMDETGHSYRQKKTEKPYSLKKYKN